MLEGVWDRVRNFCLYLGQILTNFKNSFFPWKLMKAAILANIRCAIAHFAHPAPPPLWYGPAEWELFCGMDFHYIFNVNMNDLFDPTSLWFSFLSFFVCLFVWVSRPSSFWRDFLFLIFSFKRDFDHQFFFFIRMYDKVLELSWDPESQHCC